MNTQIALSRRGKALLLAVLLAMDGVAHAQGGPTFQDGVTTPPVLTHFVQAEYPADARKAGFVGHCIVRLTVDERGIPKNVRVTRPVGMGLDESAIDAVKQGRFKPAMRGGRPVAFPLSIKVPFGQSS